MLRRAICNGVLAAIVVLAAGGSAVAAQPLPALTQRVVDDYVLVRVARLETSTTELAHDLETACGGGETARFKKVRKDFEDVALAWAAVGFLRLGPLSVLGRPERFLFWPDPRGVVHRQLARLMAQRNPAVLDPRVLGEKSVAVQGLPALEILLWNEKHPLDGDNEDARYRCALAVAMAQNLASLARDISSEWRGDDGWRRKMLEAGPQSATYKTPAEPAAELVRALVTGLQMVQDRQVAPMKTAKRGKKPRVPFERSGLSGRYAGAAIASLEALYGALDLGKDVPKEKAWMGRWIKTAFERLAADLPDAVESNAGGYDNSDRDRQLRLLRFHVEGIRKLIGRELAPLAGVTIGFNELDGD